MNLSFLWYVLIGALLGNGMPHFIWGRSNVIARSPWGRKSRPAVNTNWGLFNFIAATLLSGWKMANGKVETRSLIAILAGFWLMVAMFGVNIKEFVNDSPDNAA